MKDPVDDQFRELSWRQGLTDEERVALETHLAAQPEERAAWEAESQLNELLGKLPKAPPVSSNFTARVMQGVAMENAGRARNAAGWRWVPIRVWVARLAVACVVIGASGFALHQHQLKERKMMAQNLADLVRIYSEAGPAPVQDFDPISRLGSAAPAKADTELIALMQ